MRDLSARLGRPSVRWWDRLDERERAEWIVWWQEQHRQAEQSTEPARPAGPPPLQKGVTATRSGRDFWLGER